jgi:ABC-2 type transport system ATP-binding protein
MTATPTRPDAGPAAPLTGAAPAIRLSGLTKRYGSVTAVDGLDLTISPGEVVALLGPNGAGKSTTIDMLLGLTRPDAGTVEIHGRWPLEAIRNGAVGAMLQANGLLPDLTVRETLALTASFYARPRPVGQAMERAGVTDLARHRVGSLSGGQQQRVRFAVAMVADPSLIVLDEPTTGLDAQARRAFWAAMREETARGRTVLFATHYLDEADAYADRIVLLRSGRVVADGTAAQVKAIAAGRTIRATLPGASAAALAGLSGVESVDIHGDTILLTCRDSDAALRALLSGTAARDIEVTAKNLEDAFLALTGGEPK